MKNINTVIIELSYTNNSEITKKAKFELSNENKLPESVLTIVFNEIIAYIADSWDFIPDQYGLPQISPCTYLDDDEIDNHYHKIVSFEFSESFPTSPCSDMINFMDAWQAGGTKEWWLTEQRDVENRIAFYEDNLTKLKARALSIATKLQND